MSFLLHIETTTALCSVAISNQNEIIACCEITGQQHSSQLTLLIQEACQKANIQLKNLAGISLSQGPGSYTSLRIGAATAKGICFALNLPLFPIDSLHALALAAQKAYIAQGIDLQDKLIVPMIDARRMDAYYSIYDHNMQLIKTTACDTFDAAFLEPFKNKKLIFVGDAAPKFYATDWAKDYLFEIPSLTTQFTAHSAIHLLPLALEAFEKGSMANIYHFEPFYLKPPAFSQAKNPISFF